MKARVANCPACGGPVQFHASSSLVTVCEFCRSAVARGDKRVEDHGKVADLVQTSSRLQRGMTGKIRDKTFQVLGRVQYQHAAGGVWDEWYLLLPGDRWAWLAETQGKFYLTFERRLKEQASWPSFDTLTVGQAFQVQQQSLTVAEKGTATVRAAEGEIPWPVRPGAEHRYADLRSDDGLFATLEFSRDTPHLFVGRQVDWSDLQLSQDAWQVESDTITVGALQLNCPQCGGTLTLHAPDETQRVTCQNCGSLLDARQGKLQYLETLSVKQVHPLLPLGTNGTWQGTKYTVIGFMERYAVYEGKKFPWTEYLLYERQQGFRWLVDNDNHWSFVEPVDCPTPWPPPDAVSHNRVRYRIYDRGTAIVRYVLGEFPWSVKVGEVVETADYIAPPHMLSFERSSPQYQGTSEGQVGSSVMAAEEINVSRGTYVPVEQLEKAFGVKGLRRPWGVGPIQPAPAFGYGFPLMNVLFIAILIALQGLFSSGTFGKGTDPGLLLSAIAAVSLLPLGLLFYKHNFEVQRWSKSDYSPYATGDDE